MIGCSSRAELNQKQGSVLRSGSTPLILCWSNRTPISPLTVELTVREEEIYPCLSKKPPLSLARNYRNDGEGASKKMEEADLVSYRLPPLTDNFWKTLANFFCLPWFSRVWIVQEYVLADVI